MKTLLESALDLDADQRSAFLAAQCGEDGEVRREVEAYLRAEQRMGDFISKPIFSLRPRPGMSPGTQIGAYRVVREIGRGGMGTVYLAERSEPYAQQVAIKVLKRGMDTDEIVRRFENERQILADLEHPNIARLLDGGTTSDGLPYFVMEHVEGEPIDRYCDARGLTVTDRLELVRVVCSAVHFAHQNLVVHRDLKPTNLLVTADGVPKLLDFGIAKILKPGGAPELTRTLGDLRLMTPDYASPEQVRGRSITTASDVYSLGVLLYRLLTGRSPYDFEGREEAESARVITEIDPPRPSDAVGHEQVRTNGGTGSETPAMSWGEDSEPKRLRRRLRGDLDNIVLMAIRQEPERRYSSVAELSEDLRRHLEQLPVAARKDTLRYRAEKLWRRHTLGVLAAAGVALLVVGFTLVLFFQLEKTELQRDRAELLLDFSVELARSLDPARAGPEQPAKEDVLAKIAGQVRSGFGDQPRDRALLHDRIGRIYSSLGLYEEARPMLEEALAIRRRTLAAGDVQIAESLQNLALLLLRMGDGEVAEPLLREALEIERRQLGEEHPARARGLNDLATILKSRAEWAEAEVLFREALALKRRIHGDEHTDVVTGLNNLGEVLLRQQRPAEAEPLLRQALELGRKLLGEEHPSVGKYLQNLAVSLERQGDYPGAEAFHRQALALKEAQLGGEHPSVAFGLNNLAFCLQATGKLGEAEPLYRRALGILRERLGEEHGNVAIVERNLASLLVLRGEAASAEELARRALATMERANLPPWRVPDARSVLGHSLLAQGRFVEAEGLLLDSDARIREALGEESKYAVDAAARVAELYRAWGKPPRAGSDAG